MRCALAAAVVAASAGALSPLAVRPAHGAAPIFSSQGFDAALRNSQRSGRPLIVMFSASWCGPCKAMADGSFADAGVERYARDHATTLHLDWDKDADVFRRYNVQSLPLLIAFRDGQVVDRTLGYKDSAQLLRWMQGVCGGSPASALVPTQPQPAAPQPGGMTTQVIAPPVSAPAYQPAAEAPARPPVPSQPGTHSTVVVAAPRSQPQATPSPGAQPDDAAALVDRLRARHAALSPAINGRDKAESNKARVEFRASAARAFVRALATGRDDDARTLADEATRLDDSAWVRVAMVNKAVESGRARAWMSELLDRAQAMGADVSKARAGLDAATMPRGAGVVHADR